MCSGDCKSRRSLLAHGAKIADEPVCRRLTLGPMPQLADVVRTRLASIFGGRRVVLAGGVLAGTVPNVRELRAVGVERMLLIPTAVGTGAPPEGDDLEIELHEL